MVLWRKENLPEMKGKVSGKTHTQQQLNNYANQNNPNNKAYRANNQNMNNQKRRSRNKYDKYDIGTVAGESYGWCDD